MKSREYIKYIYDWEMSNEIYIEDVKNILYNRSKWIAKLIKDEDDSPYKQLVLDFIHLSLNRLFNYDMHKYELLISHLIFDYYKSKINRK